MLTFYLIVLAAFVALFAAHRVWSKRVEQELSEGAGNEWEKISANEPTLVDGLTREEFSEIYRRVHFPRFPGYALACLAAFFLAMPIIFALLSGGLLLAAWLGLTPKSTEFAERYLIDGDSLRFFSAAPPEVAYYYAQDLAGFYYFFGLALAWILIVYFFMRRYHARRPGYLRDELIRARKASGSEA